MTTTAPLHEVFGLACGLSLQPSMARAHRHDDVELLEGTLLKKGGLFMGWREKHFILSSKTLKYYNPSSRATPKGCLALDSLKRCCADGSPSAHLWGISPYPPMDRSDPSATTKRPHGK